MFGILLMNFEYITILRNKFARRLVIENHIDYYLS